MPEMLAMLMIEGLFGAVATIALRRSYNRLSFELAIAVACQGCLRLTLLCCAERHKVVKQHCSCRQRNDWLRA